MLRPKYIRVASNLYNYANNLLCLVLDLSPTFLRNCVFRLIFKSFGKGSSLDYGLRFRYPRRISIGSNVTVSRSCSLIPGYLVKDSHIELEDHVVIGPQVTLIGAGHDAETLSDVGGRIIIKSKSYIGAGTIIRYGVTVGEESVVGAGSFLTKDVEPRSLLIQKRINEIRPL